MSIVQNSLVIYILHFEHHFLSTGAESEAVGTSEISGNGWKL